VRALASSSLACCNRPPSESDALHDQIRLRQHPAGAVAGIGVRIGLAREARGHGPTRRACGLLVGQIWPSYRLPADAAVVEPYGVRPD
jgi:hypothetical protein